MPLRCSELQSSGAVVDLPLGGCANRLSFRRPLAQGPLQLELKALPETPEGMSVTCAGFSTVS